MKTNLQITGRAELDRTEISQAIVEYLEKHHNYKVEKIVYQMSVNSFNGAIVEIIGATTNTQEKITSYHIDKPVTRNNEGGHRKINKGVFDTIRDLLNEEFVKARKANNGIYTQATVAFDGFLKDIVDLYPGMDAEKLSVYLHDKRQFTNMDWNGKTKIITIKGTITHI